MRSVSCGAIERHRRSRGRGNTTTPRNSSSNPQTSAVHAAACRRAAWAALSIRSFPQRVRVGAALAWSALWPPSKVRHHDFIIASPPHPFRVTATSPTHHRRITVTLAWPSLWPPSEVGRTARHHRATATPPSSRDRRCVVSPRVCRRSSARSRSNLASDGVAREDWPLLRTMQPPCAVRCNRRVPPEREART